MVLSIKSSHHSRSQFRLLLSASAHANLGSFCDTDMSASYGGFSPLEYDAEKALAYGEDGAGREKGMLTLGDASGMLPDYKASDYLSSLTSSSASSDTESVGEEEEG
jgi:hypothetical protein